MPNLQVIPVQELMLQERRLAAPPIWGVPHCCLTLSRRGGWVVITKAYEPPKVVELGK